MVKSNGETGHSRRVTKADAPARDGDTESRILDAAHAVFLRRGTAGARMQEIADEAGVNKALLHYYFRSKSRLADAVFLRVASGVFGRLGQLLASDAPIEDTVQRVIALYLDLFSRAPFVPGYVISEINQHPGRARQLLAGVRRMRSEVGATDLLRNIDRQIRARVSAGTLRPITARQFVVNLVSLCVFPFAARPMICAALDLDDDGFHRLIEERKRSLPRFFLDALRP